MSLTPLKPSAVAVAQEDAAHVKTARASDGWLSGLVHGSIAPGTAAYSQHTRFIAGAVLLGAIPLIIMPVLLLVDHTHAELQWVISAFALVAIALAYGLSRWGNLQASVQTSFFAVAGFIAAMAFFFGGLMSPVLLLLAVLPIEGALRFGKRGLLQTVFAVLAGLLALALAVQLKAPQNIVPSTVMLMVTGILGSAYIAWLAVRLASHHNHIAVQIESERTRFRLIAENATDLVTRHGRRGETFFASPATQQLLGVPATDLLNKGLLERIHLQDRVVFLKALSDAYHGGEHEVTIRLRSKGGAGTVWKRCAMTVRSQQCSQTGKMQLVAVSRDIQDLSSVQAELKAERERNASAEQAQRQFITTMSHELRTPLNAIIGFSDILKQELFGQLANEKQREYVALINESGEHLLQVVNEMLDLSRIRAGRYELSISTFDVGDVVTATTGMLQSMASEEDVLVTASVADGLAEMRADRRACQQILINLLSNAIKFTPASGSVCLKVDSYQGTMRFVITDTGIGMDKAFMARIGEPFLQADCGHNRRFEGSGLGLSVVKGLVELHEGSLKFDSRVGEGTTVTVRLPMRPAQSRPIPADDASTTVRLQTKPPALSAPDFQETDNSQTMTGETSARVSA